MASEAFLETEVVSLSSDGREVDIRCDVHEMSFVESRGRVQITSSIGMDAPSLVMRSAERRAKAVLASHRERKTAAKRLKALQLSFAF